MNNFFNTAVGKSFKTALWIATAYALAYGTAWVSGYQWSASWVALGVPGLVNWLLYTAKVFVDKEVPNLPGSPVKVLLTVPAAPPEVPPETPPTPDEVPTDPGQGTIIPPTQ